MRTSIESGQIRQQGVVGAAAQELHFVRNLLTQRNPLRRLSSESMAEDAKSDTLQGLRNGALGALLTLVPSGVSQAAAIGLLAESGVQLVRGGLETVIAIFQNLSPHTN